jgi:hypothetical protein
MCTGNIMYICKFCQNERKSANSLRNHERLCKLNSERQTTWIQNNHAEAQVRRGKAGFLNGASKAKLEGREFIVKESTRKLISIAVKNRDSEFHDDISKKVSKTVQEKVKNGEWHTSLARNMHINYKGNDLHGTWELKYAQYLDGENINWIRNKDSFKYLFDGKERYYTPDFYLIDSDEYIEIKGYKTEKDDAKWSQFPKHRKLIVLMERELKEKKII